MGAGAAGAPRPAALPRLRATKPRFGCCQALRLFAALTLPQEFSNAGDDGGDDMAWDAALADALLSGPAADTTDAARPSSGGSRCRIRGCSTALTAGYSQRAKCVRPSAMRLFRCVGGVRRRKAHPHADVPSLRLGRLCDAHLHAHSVPLPDTGAPGRFCQRCHKLQPLAAFSGTKRTCDAALLAFNRKRRAQQHGQGGAAAAHPGAKGEACAAALAVPLRDPDESVPSGLEATLRERLGTFIACTSAMRDSLAAAAPPLTPDEARKLHFCMPPMQDACAQLAADAATLTALRASLTAEEAAEAPAWRTPAVAAAQRAEGHLAMMASWAARAAETAEDPGALVPRTSSSGRALVAPLRPCVESMNALLAHTQAALALLRLESRGRYLEGAALACELSAALMRRAEEVCKERGAWLHSNLQVGEEAPTTAA